jgi:hypothetical protein
MKSVLKWLIDALREERGRPTKPRQLFATKPGVRVSLSEPTITTYDH